MPTVVKLDLPAPPRSLQQQMIQDLEKISLNPEPKRWLDEFHAPDTNSALHMFDLAPESWQQPVQDLYQGYFDGHRIAAGFGIMKNANDRPACLPPHTDRGRALAINFYLNLGGSNVQTKFYNVNVETKPNESTNFSYGYVGQHQHSKVFEQAWYAYNVNQAHSVENIESTRYVLLLLIQDQLNYNLNCLIKDYPQLILHGSE